MEIPVEAIVTEIISGSESAVVALLVGIICVLLYEIRTQRTLNAEAQKQLQEERTQAMAAMTTMQDKFLSKTEEMVDKYYQSNALQRESNEKIQGMLSNVLLYINK